MSRAIVKTTFEASRTIRPIYTGGSTALDASGRILLSCVGEDALIVDLETGDHLASLEGVSESSAAEYGIWTLLTASHFTNRMEKLSQVWPVRPSSIFSSD